MQNIFFLTINHSLFVTYQTDNEIITFGQPLKMKQKIKAKDSRHRTRKNGSRAREKETRKGKEILLC